jgi:hypothetical protein
MKKTLITLILTTIIGAIASFIFFPEHLAIFTCFGFLVGLVILTEIQVHYINKEIAQCREKFQGA